MCGVNYREAKRPTVDGLGRISEGSAEPLGPTLLRRNQVSLWDLSGPAPMAAVALCPGH